MKKEKKKGYVSDAQVKPHMDYIAGIIIFMRKEKTPKKPRHENGRGRRGEGSMNIERRMVCAYGAEKKQQAILVHVINIEKYLRQHPKNPKEDSTGKN